MTVHTHAIPFATGTINAELASKSNSRRIVRNGGRVRSIKSAPALSFASSAAHSILVGRLNGTITRDTIPPPYAVTVRAVYRSERPDLDVALLLDALQASGVITNDRGVVELHCYKLPPDKTAPRVEWEVRHLPAPFSFPERAAGQVAA